MEGVMREYEVTKAEHFHLGNDHIVVEYSDLESGWYWRLIVNGKATSWSGFYANFICLNGYAIISEYYSGNIKPWIPFLVTYATEDKS
jgi:hypothetical protein